MTTTKGGHERYGWQQLGIEIKSNSDSTWQTVREERGFACIAGARRSQHAGWSQPTRWIKLILSDPCGGDGFGMTEWEVFACTTAESEACASTINQNIHRDEHLSSLYVWDGHLPDAVLAEVAVKLSSSIVCPLGTYFSNPSNQTSAVTVDACTACSPGKYTDILGATSEEECIACPAGKYLGSSGNDEVRDCIECVAGKYSTARGATSSSTCQDCVAGKFSETAGNDVEWDCRECAAGKYSTVVGASDPMTCQTCPSGKYNLYQAAESIRECVDCEYGKFSGVVGAGYYPCRECVAGTHSTVAGANSSLACVACPAGKYLQGIMVYIETESGVSGSGSGSGAPADPDPCVSCEAGKYSETASNDEEWDCRKCSAGKYSTVRGATSRATCLDCAPGKYLSSAGSSQAEDCVLCPRDSFNPNPGAVDVSFCRSCPRGSSTDGATGRTSEAECACPDTHYSNFTIDEMSQVTFECMLCVDGGLCAPGSFRSSRCNATSNTQCDPCSAGKYSAVGAIREDQCLLCSRGKFSVQGSVHCAECEAGKYGPEVEMSACFDCPPGFYSEDVGQTSTATCQACVAGTYSGLAGAVREQTCILCSSGSFSTGSGQSTCQHCPISASSPAGSLTLADCECNAGYTPSGNTTLAIILEMEEFTCGPCERGSFKARGGIGECTLCEAGRFSDMEAASACSQCPLNSMSATGATTQEDCHCLAGFTGESSDACLPCPAGSWKPENGSSPCMLCEAGKFNALEGSILPCEACSAGKYGANEGAASSDLCRECRAGTYSSQEGASSPDTCLSCAAGNFSQARSAVSADTCEECPADTYSREGSAACTPCPMNSEAPSRSTSPESCTCKPGFQSATLGGLCFDPDADCPSGSYKDYDPAIGFQCTSCATGKQGPLPGATDESACELCSAGKYGESQGASACLDCPAGTGNSEMGSDSSEDCAECEAGKYSASPSASSCVDCPAGKYGQYSAALQCVECHANSASGLGSTSKLSCICRAGFTGQDGISCNPCRPGSFKLTNGSAECAACEAGSYMAESAATVCAACAPNSDSARASAEAAACICNAGYAGPDGGPCSACQPGRYKALAGSTPCVLCPAGTFGAEEGQRSCAGNCSSDSFSLPGSDDQEDCKCNAGYTGADGGPCFVCVAGRFKESPGSVECVVCQPGTFSEAVGAKDKALCLSCPVNTTSGAGATRADDCSCNAGYTGKRGGPCTACKAGFHKPRLGEEPCIECLAGTYSHPDTSTFNVEMEGVEAVCVQEGFEGAPNCSACPAHSFSPPRSFRRQHCVCDAGHSGSNGGECTACVPGFYKHFNGSSPCITCAPGFYSSVDAATICSQCPPGSFAPAEASSRLTKCTCNAGYDGPDGGPCEQCAEGKYRPAAEDGCIACEGGKYSNATGSTSCLACPLFTLSPVGSDEQKDCACVKGYSGGAGGPCVACSAGTFKATDGSAECVACDAGSYSALTAASSCLSCPLYTVAPVGSNARTDCSCRAGFTRESGSESCVPCGPGSFKSVPGQSPCVLCVADTFNALAGQNSSDACLPCPAFSTSLLGSSSREACSCAAGYQGTQCAEGDAGCEASTACERCIPGKYKQITGPSPCLQCAVGKYSKTSRTSCSSCEAGKFSIVLAATSESNCTRCARGKYSEARAATSAATCLTCIAGKFSINEGATSPQACTDCAEGTYAQAPGSSACVSCQAGTYGNIQGAASADLACVRCPAGAYSETVGASSPDTCIPCAAGTHSAVSGALSADLCLPCGANTYAAQGSTACTPCPMNSQSDLESTSVQSCVCIQGFDNGGIVGGICFDASGCPAGAYQSGSLQEGNFACPSCTSGKYGPDKGATSEAACLDCGFGKFSAAAASSFCSDCITGTYSGRMGATKCTACRAGKYSSNSSSTSCLFCAAGKFGPSSALTSCLECDFGTYGPNFGANSSSACLPCSAGKIGSSRGAVEATECVSCAAGTFSAAQSSACTQCIVNAWSHAESQSRTDCICNPGYDGVDGGPCEPCAAGYAKPNRGYWPQCKRCVEGKYAAAPSAASVCLDCPFNSNAPLGSDAIADCSCNPGFTGANGENCTACSAGSYKTVVGSSKCVACGAGKYSTATAAASSAMCQACPAGSASNKIGANSSETCDACRPGTYAVDAGADACDPCNPGTYSVDTGATHAGVCVPCPAGTNSSLPGATSVSVCNFCRSGTYSPPSAADCIDCPLNSWSLPQSGSVELCLCLPGYYGAIGEDCESCAGGKFLPFSGARTDQCESCHAGTSASAGSSTCTTCHAGKFAGPEFAACKTCPRDTFSTAGAHNCTNCTLDYCEVAEYRRRCLPGSTSDGECLECQIYRRENTMFVGHGGYNDTCPEACRPPYKEDCLTGLCKRCDPGQVSVFTLESDDKAYSCRQCPTGGTCDGGEEVICAESRYLIHPDLPESSNSFCEPCPKGAVVEDGRCAFAFKNVSASPTITGTWEPDPDSGTRYVLVACPAGFSRKGKERVALDKQECVECHPQLEYILDPNNDDCVTCPPGLICNGNSKVEPVVNRSRWYIEDDHFVLESCPYGYQVISTEGEWQLQQCEACAEGFECVLQVCQICTVCETGKFKDLIGTQACTRCPQNTYNPVTNSKSTANCQSCPVGALTQGDGKSNLTDCECERRFYRAETSSTWECSACPQGAMCADGSCSLRNEPPHCEVDPQPIGSWDLGSLIGKSGQDAGKKWLTACPTGFDLQDNSHDLQKCQPCGKGQECKLDICRVCIPCKPGYYKAQSSIDPCAQCPANTYLMTEGATELSFCISCPENAHTFTLTGRTSQADCTCNTRMYSDAQPDFKCMTCPAGAVCPNGICSLPTQKCTAGEIKGTWERGSDGKFALLSCPIGHQLVNETGHDVQTCVRCEAGFFIMSSSDPNEICQKCPASAECPNRGPPMFQTTAVSASMAMTADPDDMSAILDSLAEMLRLDPDLLELENAGSTGSRRTAQAMVISFKVYATPEQLAELDAALNDPSLPTRMGVVLQSRGVSADVQPAEISSISGTCSTLQIPQ